MYGFSPVCVLICLFISPFEFWTFEQNGHPNWPPTSLIGPFCKRQYWKGVWKKNCSKIYFVCNNFGVYIYKQVLGSECNLY